MNVSDEMGERLRSLIGKKFIIVVLGFIAMIAGKIDGLAWIGIAGAYLAADQIQTHQELKKLPVQ